MDDFSSDWRLSCAAVFRLPGVSEEKAGRNDDDAYGFKIKEVGSLGGIVVRPTRAEVAEAAGLGNPFDWESFQWGMVAGGVIVTTVGGVVLYFTWPYILAACQAFPFFREMAAAYKALVG